ncbi:MAG: cytochrome c oxidase subunit II, partial [Bdellovibrionota bacterium]
MNTLEKLFSFMLPEQASTTAGLIDQIFYAIIGMSALVTILFVIVIVWFAIKYRRKREGQKTGTITGSHKLEIIWTVIPTIVFVAIAFYGWSAYRVLEHPPDNAYHIRVIAKQWAWIFNYTVDGKEVQTLGQLYVPINRPVVLDMTSLDVIHSFSVPAFRVKKDVVPGLRTKVWFTPNRPGAYQAYCTEFCGTAHSKMLATVQVVSEVEFEHWLQAEAATSTTASPSVLGAKLYEIKGCKSCHTLTGVDDVGPSFRGLFGKKREFEEGPPIEAADENYIRKSILDPKSQVVKGFKPKM